MRWATRRKNRGRPAASGISRFGGRGLGRTDFTSPTEAGELAPGYILVCPGTDPSWTPLFAEAAGLVLERGGMLSHGSVVAREMGLPAIVLPDAMCLFHDGEEICVNGNGGWVGRKAELGCPESPAPTTEADDVRISRRSYRHCRDKKTTGRRTLATDWPPFGPSSCWPFFYCPSAGSINPRFRPWILLWPIVRGLGKPAAVAIIAAIMAVLTLAVEKLFTDTHGLREAKRRAAALNKIANSLPPESPQHTAMQRLAEPVPLRTLAAAMVPVGILLGPMVMPFFWLKERVDPRLQRTGRIGRERCRGGRWRLERADPAQHATGSRRR